MIYFIYGKDDIRVKSKYKELVDKYALGWGVGNFQYIHWDSSENLDLGGIDNFLRSESLFEDKKIAVLDYAFEGDLEGLEIILKKSGLSELKDNVLFVASYKSKQECKKNNEKLLKYLTSNKVKSEEIKDLSPGNATTWARNLIKQEGLSMDPKAFDKLITYTEKNTRLIFQEVKKLLCYKLNKTITEEDVDLMVSKYGHAGAFSIVDAIAENDKARAIRLYHDYIESGQDLHQLFGAFVYQFRNMLVVKDLVEKGQGTESISKKVKLHPFVLGKTQRAIQKFDIGRLKNAYVGLANAEINIKTGRGDISGEIFDFMVGV